jgi:quaternary ammonium compound-resistance protein SugE
MEDKIMNWILLLIAGALEVFWAVEMKYSNGFSLVVPTVLTIIGYIASAIFLSLAIKQLPLGTAYAVWTGIGIIGTSVLGVFLFKERLTLPQAICILLIVAGIMGLRLLGEN